MITRYARFLAQAPWYVWAADILLCVVFAVVVILSLGQWM